MSKDSSKAEKMASSTSLKWRVDQVTTCPICLEQFNIPKSLPCLHTFCLNCLSSYCGDKRPEDNTRCPVCRKEFTIPKNWLDGLPHNFFVKTLIDASESSDSEKARFAFCEVCEDTAAVYCADCNQQLCDRCSLPHKKWKGGAHHLQVLGQKLKTEVIKMRGSYCEKHSTKQMELYCFNCKANICMMCFAVGHQQHKCREIVEVAREMSKRMDADFAQVSTMIDGVNAGTRHLMTVKNEFIESIKQVEAKVVDRGETLKRLIDEQVGNLLRELRAEKSVALKEIDSHKESYDMALVALKSFKAYSAELRAKGSPCDITRTADDVHNRALELKEQYADFAIPETSYTPPHMEFIEMKNTVSLSENMVGQVTVTSLIDITDDEGSENGVASETKVLYGHNAAAAASDCKYEQVEHQEQYTVDDDNNDLGNALETVEVGWHKPKSKKKLQKARTRP